MNTKSKQDNKKSAATAPARKLPFNFEAEQAVLGSVMLSQDAPLVILNELNEKDFYTKEHQIIFSAMQSLFLQKNNVIDHITLTSELEREQLLDEVGGVGYLVTLTNVIPSAANFQYYMDIVKRDSVLRQLIYAGGEIIENSYTSDDREKALEYAETSIYKISQTADRSNLEHIRPSLEEVVSQFEENFQNPGARRGLETGFAGLDQLTNGLQNSDLILLAARPGVGKSSLAMNIVEHAALHNKKACAVFSLEMPRIQLARRIACRVAKVSQERTLRGELDEVEQRRFRKAIALLAEAPIYIDDSSLNTPAEILSKCRRIKNDPSRGLDFVVIDYLQLMSMGGKSGQESRQQVISEISRNLKILARELNVPVLVLSQLSRAVESRTDHRPVLSDLRESGAIEQDADIVMFIYKSSMYRDIDENEFEPDTAELIIGKHRNGALGTIKLRWNGDTTSFYDDARSADRASLENTAPPMPKKFKDAFEKAKETPVGLKEVESIEDVFEIPDEIINAPLPEGPSPEEIDDIIGQNTTEKADPDPFFDEEPAGELSPLISENDQDLK